MPFAKQNITLRSTVEDIPRLAEFVDSVSEAAGFDPAQIMSLNLALEEAVANVMFYAYPEGEGTILVEAAPHEGGGVEFRIEDSGIAFDPTAAAEADTSLGVEERQIGGLGIHLVRQIMDSVEYRRSPEGKNILTLIKTNQ